MVTLETQQANNRFSFTNFRQSLLQGFNNRQEQIDMDQDTQAIPIQHPPQNISFDSSQYRFYSSSPNYDQHQKYQLTSAVSCLPKNMVLAGVSNAAAARDLTVSGREISGEDAYFVTDVHPDYSAIGVADGVGGWNSMGVDPSLFAWELVEFCKLHSEMSDLPMPWDVLELAYQSTVQSKRVSAGSSTACLLSLDKQSGLLYSANLGDSGFFVFRFMEAPVVSEVSEDSSFDISASSSGRSLKSFVDQVQRTASQMVYSDSQPPKQPHLQDIELVYESIESQHYFNAPYQLAIIPEEIPIAQRKLFMQDQPSDANKETFGPLRDGDIIVTGTDGLFDNMFPDDISRIIQVVMGDVVVQRDPVLRKQMVNETAEQLTRQAAACALSPRMSPFAKDAQEYGWTENTGGKVDDITVIVSVVSEVFE